MNAAARAVAAGFAAPLALWALSMNVDTFDGAAVRAFVRVLVPLSMVIAYYPTFIELVARGDAWRVVRVSLLWALTVSVTTIVCLRFADPNFATADAFIWNARDYRMDMFHWIRTGIGQEGDPARFVPQHALHCVAFAVLALASRGFLGLVLGAVLLNYMNAYVSALLHHARDSLGAAAILVATAWPAYAVVRVVGFICIATALTLFVHSRKRRISLPTPARRTMWIGIALVAADAVLKAMLAPAYREVFSRFTTLVD